MKIKLSGELKTVMSNPYSHHNYFAWPTATRLQNGKIALGASGFRLSHICPFGKSVIAYSENEGESYTPPAPVIDTCLDDRDVGICTFGKSGVIFTSFNNTVKFQRGNAKGETYRAAYLDTVSEEEQNAVLGSTFRISHDCGVTFGEIHRSPVTSPHGPCELADGTVLYVGRTWETEGEDAVMAYTVNTDTGDMTYVGKIAPVYIDGELMLSCEPHAIQLSNGDILCHIRVQALTDGRSKRVFTTYQSVSKDNGKTWSKPVPLFDDILGGAPAHLMIHSSGVIISSYAVRKAPYGIRVMFSKDNGKTWDKDNILYETDISSDLGYPATVELTDGSLLTVFYARTSPDGNAVIYQQKWRME